MKINWKVRFKNKEWLVTFASALIAFIYQMLGLFGIVSPVTEDSLVQCIAIVINIMCTLGIVIDPTTSGTADSDRALTYTEPGRSYNLQNYKLKL